MELDLTMANDANNEEYFGHQEAEFQKNVLLLKGAFRSVAPGGEISNINDLLRLLRSLGLNPTESEVLEIMHKHDEDGDDRMDEEEFLIAMKDHWQVFDTQEEINLVFRMFDKKGKGFISLEDLRYMFRIVLGDKYEEIMNDIEDIVQQFDKDKDGKVHYSEFVETLLS